MGKCDIDETLENTRLILQLAHERNEKLAFYIRITDGAIWGFLGLSALELFKDGFDLQSPKVPFFGFIHSLNVHLADNDCSIPGKYC
jgi:hypothetical protein